MEDLTETWPVGFRFKPTESELVDHHLRRKLKGEEETICVIPELYIYKWDPLDLFARYNALSSIPSDGHECFFFCPRDNKIPNSLRLSRRTEFGFWKDTSKKRVVRAPGTGEEIGFKRILVYYEGRQGDARRTPFSMHEYHLNLDVSNSEIPGPMEFVLCHIINRKCEKAGSESAIMSAGADVTIPSILSNSEFEGAQGFRAQASPAVTVEPDSSNHTMLNYDLPDHSASVPRQPDTFGMESSLCNDNWFVDGASDEHLAPSCPLSDDVIYFTDLWS
ncbi:hypothetical protein BT93_G0391 [Corymbia citriodora subsp. variegata]|nr:hypothetical protein BT93_G0391 [Corymbia citriodora subsp. variegata]